MWRRKTQRNSVTSSVDQSPAVDNSNLGGTTSSRGAHNHRRHNPTSSRTKNARSSSLPSPRRAVRNWRSTARMEQLVADEIENALFGPGCDDYDERDDDDENEARRVARANDYPCVRGCDEYNPQRRRHRRLSLSKLRGSSVDSPGGGRRGSSFLSEGGCANSTRGRRFSLSFAANSDAISPRGRHRRRRRTSMPTESSINRYSLFENDNNFTQSTNSLSSAPTGLMARKSQLHHTKSPTILYDKNYHPNVAFTPLIMFLGVTFVILLVLRIIVSLLTVAMGLIVLIIAAITFVDFMRNPLTNSKRLIVTIHNSPVIVFGAMGGSCGACICLWVYRKTDEASLIWALFEGTVYGVEVGALWLAILGDGSDYSSTALWIVNLFHKISNKFFRETLEEEDDDSSSTLGDDTLHDADDRGAGKNKECLRKCLICLSRLGPEDARKLLPCLHSFHPDCLGTLHPLWLRRNSLDIVCVVSFLLHELTPSLSIEI